MRNNVAHLCHIFVINDKKYNFVEPNIMREMKKPDNLNNTLPCKTQLEALLAVASRKDEFVNNLRAAINEKEAEKRLMKHFGISQGQSQFLLNIPLSLFLSLTPENVQRGYNKVSKLIEQLTRKGEIKDYADNRKMYLGEWARRKGLDCYGLYRGIPYCHILFLENDSKKLEVAKQNLLEGVNADLLEKIYEDKKLHTEAHHLNSSQLLCYNFFRPLIDKGLIAMLKEMGIEDIASIEKCEFEYTDGWDKWRSSKDETEFDFHICCKRTSGEDIEIFFEVKYTENEFTTKKISESLSKKFDDVYKSRLDKADCLYEKPADAKAFVGNYQLYRNAIRITDKNKYLVLLYPSGNKNVDEQANTFINGSIKDEYRDNVKIIHIDKLPLQKEFGEKYFGVL